MMSALHRLSLGLIRVLLSGLIFIFAFAPAQAAEVIDRFVSSVKVERDGTLEVVEEITFDVEGKKIQRGINRDFPTTYKRSDGTIVKVGFEVLDVRRNGSPEVFALENVNNLTRVRIGDADKLLAAGFHTFSIRYRTSRQLGFFEKHDELYWNVTGNDWDFPINEVAFNLALPDGAVINRTEVFTGQRSERGTNATINRNGPNGLQVISNKPLRRGEGLSVVTGWQKGIVAPPTSVQERAWWLRDNLGFLTLFATLCAALLYYLFSWFRVGRDPAKGVIFPQFHPPQGLGPAGVRYVWKQDYDNRGFAAALVGLAVKGHLKIEDSDDGYAIARQTGSAKSLELTRSEAALLAKIPNKRIEMDSENREAFAEMQAALSKQLDDEYDGAMFLDNFNWFVGGAIISLLGLVIAAFMLPEGQGFVALVPLGFMIPWWAVILFVGRLALTAVIQAPSFWNRLRNLMGILFLVPFIAVGIFLPFSMYGSIDVSQSIAWFIGAALAILLMNFLFYWWLKAPTPHGRKTLDQVEGFRMYLETAEEDRLNKLNPPEKTPELFERYLPYAMALDCENEWNAKFASVLAATAAAGAATGGAAHPSWYSGNNWGNRSFGTDFGSGLTAASASASAPPPGSSSGFSGGDGGGGGSGGGGGGGGGSGW
jgi:uncharacterized membrane protein YgcG